MQLATPATPAIAPTTAAGRPPSSASATGVPAPPSPTGACVRTLIALPAHSPPVLLTRAGKLTGHSERSASRQKPPSCSFAHHSHAADAPTHASHVANSVHGAAGTLVDDDGSGVADDSGVTDDSGVADDSDAAGVVGGVGGDGVVGGEGVVGGVGDLVGGGVGECVAPGGRGVG